MDLVWRENLGQQFGAAIDMFENALRNCPDELWGTSLWSNQIERPEFSEFWYIAYHTLFWFDLYLSGAVEGFSPPAPFTLDELDPAGLLPDRQYTQDELLEYLDHCRKKCQATIRALTADRAEQTCQFPWGEVQFLGLCLDNMRHVQEHSAQLGMFLGQNAGVSSRWVASKRDSFSM